MVEKCGMQNEGSECVTQVDLVGTEECTVYISNYIVISEH